MDTIDRSAYMSESILAKDCFLPNNTWETGLNCNQLVLGPTGSGKTRNFLKPNLLQANASYLVMDTKGLLYREVGPILADLGYEIQNIDFTDVCGTVGYDPLDHIRRDPETGEPSQKDIISVAGTLCPVQNFHDSFWDLAASNFLASYIAYVLETYPRELQTMDSVIELYESATSPKDLKELYGNLARTHPDSYALRIYRRVSSGFDADKMHSSIMGILAEKMMTLAFKEAFALYHMPKKVDFAALGHRPIALFVTVSDVDHSLRSLTDTFVAHAFQGLIAEADACPNGFLPHPVRLFLDDFSNLQIPHFDDIISVIRSREIWCTILCQSISQLNQRYGEFGAETIVANCDVQMVLAFSDNTTTQVFAPLAAKTMDTLRATPLNMSWLFVRGRKARCVEKYDVTRHPNFRE